jgi:hypothetical protein
MRRSRPMSVTRTSATPRVSEMRSGMADARIGPTRPGGKEHRRLGPLRATWPHGMSANLGAMRS